jgi:hypothetical protein
MQTNQDCHHYFHIKMVIVYNMNTTMISPRNGNLKIETPG